MSEAKQILESIISDFSPGKFIRFFREKNRNFIARENNYSRYNDSDFNNGTQFGEIKLQDNDSLLICAFEVKKPLSERAGKKAQYDKAKAILKATENQIYCAGIFIFYNASGNFRFSLVYPEAIGTTRQWNNFRRFTYFVSKEFTNKTFKQRVGDGDFSSLEKIKDAFSVEKVTKEFYQDIANWYFWAVAHSEFPKDAEAEDNGRNIAVIRLITRMIFIWFMRERGLLPKELFENNKIGNILKDINDEESTYYKAILQNLFFATLSTKKNERCFGSEIRGYKGNNPDYDNQYVFRYHELFENPGKIQIYFGDIPFLNGGLFECLDDKKNGIIIDGFSRTKKNQPIIPNFLFFSEEKKADLNKVYGTKNKTYKVQGLIDILSSFNFTIDENSLDDADVALDPELLGRVFENLLASFNPETSTTARKATGSYYTPREIVDYMVTESFKAYFKTHLDNIASVDEKMKKLFSNADDANPFSADESKKIVELIENVKIVDPAVGSGAFPMGALNKLVFILGKVDKNNELWKQAQLNAINSIPDPSARRIAKEKIQEFFEGKNADYGRKLYLIQRCIYGVDIQQIAVEIAKLRFFISLLVDEKIDKGKENWGIEPLPNLDFKIMQGNSLISEFLGIDFDNGHNKQTEHTQTGLLFAQDDDNLIKEFEQRKIDFQNEADKDKKKKLKQEVEDLMIQIFKNKVKKQKADYFKQIKEIEKRALLLPNQTQRENIIQTEKQKLSKKYAFDLENIEKQLREFTSKKKTRPFFPWKLYFAEVFEKGGFDIVIGNPPYVEHKKLKGISNNLKESYATYSGTADLYVYFYEKGIKISKENGILFYITSNKFIKTSYGEQLRKYFTNYQINEIIDFTKVQVFDALVASCIFCITKRKAINNNNILISFANDSLIHYPNLKEYIDSNNFFLNQNNLNHTIWQLETDNKLLLKNKIEDGSKTIEKTGTINICRGVTTGYNPAFIIDEEERRSLIEDDKTNKTIIKPLLQGRNIRKWSYKRNNEYLLQTGYDENIKKQNPAIFRHLKQFENELKIRSDQGINWWNLRACKYYSEFEKEKIIWGLTADKWAFAYDNDGNYLPSNGYILTSSVIPVKYLLALLNSSLMEFYFGFIGIMTAGGAFTLKYETIIEFPIKVISNVEQNPFIALVDKILSITSSEDYLQNPNKQDRVKEYEKEIDRMVYVLYDLTPEEIKIVEGTLNKEKEKT